jgi:hypothetical protein
LFLTLMFLCCSASPAETPRSTSADFASQVTMSADDGVPASEDAKPAKPDSPAPKITAPSGNETESPAANAAASSNAPMLNNPAQPSAADSYETPRKRMIWYSLIAAGHGTAAFDAWTTRRAISSGFGTEGDPFQKPFAHSGAIYASTQVSPLVMDYVGYRLMRSHSPLLRRFWWVPQTASASISLSSGIHNYRVVP